MEPLTTNNTYAMNFKNNKDAYRYHAVGGFESKEQDDFYSIKLINEIGMKDFLAYKEEIAKEVSLGIFLTPPPVLIL